MDLSQQLSSLSSCLSGLTRLLQQHQSGSIPPPPPPPAVRPTLPPPPAVPTPAPSPSTSTSTSSTTRQRTGPYTPTTTVRHQQFLSSTVSHADFGLPPPVNNPMMFSRQVTGPPLPHVTAHGPIGFQPAQSFPHPPPPRGPVSVSFPPTPPGLSNPPGLPTRPVVPQPKAMPLPAWATPHLQAATSKSGSPAVNQPVHPLQMSPQQIQMAIAPIYNVLRHGGDPPPRDRCRLLARYMLEANFNFARHIVYPAVRFGFNEPHASDAGRMTRWEFWRQALTNMPGPSALENWGSEITPLKFFHCTNPVGLRGILATGRLQTTPWEQEGAGSHGVYGRAFISDYRGVNEDHPEYCRMMKNLSKLGKNITGFVLERSAFVKTKALNQGGIEAEAATVARGLATHMRREKRWCIHEDDLRIVAIWYVHDGGSEFRTN
jgi:hypothetical protein